MRTMSAGTMWFLDIPFFERDRTYILRWRETAGLGLPQIPARQDGLFTTAAAEQTASAAACLNA